MVRAFLAIDLPKELKKELSELAKVSPREGIKGKWVEEPNLHLTLHFFGSISERMVEKIIQEGEKLFPELSPIELEIEELGFFPERGKPRVLWIGVKDKQDSLSKLYKEVKKLLEKLKLEERKENFHPHITLLRIKEITNQEKFLKDLQKIKEKAKDLKGYSFLIKEVILFKSELTPKGPIYTPLKNFPLKEGRI